MAHEKPHIFVNVLAVKDSLEGKYVHVHPDLREHLKAIVNQMYDDELRHYGESLDAPGNDEALVEMARSERFPLCSVCDQRSDPLCYVGTGGGCDYDVCSKAHADVVWLALDASQVAEENNLTHPAWPVIHPPDWIEAKDPHFKPGTIEQLLKWSKVPENAEALRKLRGDTD